MALHHWRKRAGEVKTVVFDFTDELATGTTLTGTPTVTADAGLTVGMPALATPKVSVQLSGGVLGTSYYVTCQATATNGDVHEIPAVLEIIGE